MDKASLYLIDLVADIVGLTKKQKMDIGILVHVLYSNPKVLYSPNNSDVDAIISKVAFGYGFYRIPLYGCPGFISFSRV